MAQPDGGSAPKSAPKRSKRRRIRPRTWTVGAISLIFIVGVLYVLFLPKLQDPLCRYVRSFDMVCLALPADEETYRPGAISQLVADPHDPTKFRLSLPNSYLDKTCVIAGASLEQWKPSAVPFSLAGVRYNRSALASMNGQISPDFRVNIGPKASTIQAVELTFGEARVSLLDELALVGRIENCAIKPQCITLVKDQKYRIVNRSLVVDNITYELKDSRDASLSIADLPGEALTLAGAFSKTESLGTKLMSKRPLALAVQLISDDAIRKANPCTAGALYMSDGVSEVSVASAGRTVKSPPSEFGRTATAEIQGVEHERGSNNIRSNAKAYGLTHQTREGELRIVATALAQGGQYEERNLSGTVRHETIATAAAEASGVIRVLVRSGPGMLRVGWVGLPVTSNNPATAVNSIEIQKPDGTLLETIKSPTGTGSAGVWLDAQGQYSVVGKTVLKSQAKGPSGRVEAAVDARLTATMDFKAGRPAAGTSQEFSSTTPRMDPRSGNAVVVPHSASPEYCAGFRFREMAIFSGCDWDEVKKHGVVRQP
jgi:hypothetical protein